MKYLNQFLQFNKPGRHLETFDVMPDFELSQGRVYKQHKIVNCTTRIHNPWLTSYKFARHTTYSEAKKWRKTVHYERVDFYFQNDVKLSVIGLNLESIDRMVEGNYRPKILCLGRMFSFILITEPVI